jgi:hypothetical protein
MVRGGSGGRRPGVAGRGDGGGRGRRAVAPVTGTVYCSVIDACQEVLEWRGAQEWAAQRQNIDRVADEQGKPSRSLTAPGAVSVADAGGMQAVVVD